MDEEGRNILISAINHLKLKDGSIDHDHLMTPSWAGTELTEDMQGNDNLLINKLNIFLVS